MKVVPIAIGIACLVVASVAHLGTKIQEERKIKDYLREEIRRDCYVRGDKQNNFICDCFIEEALSHNDPNELLVKYNKDAFPIIEQITSDYFNVCLNKVVKAKIEGKI